MPVESYSRTPANNNSAPPNGCPEGWSPASVNDWGRQLMTDVVNEATSNKCKVLASVAGTNTITASMSPALTAYSAGMLVVLTPANTNTGAATLNIDTLGALDVFRYGGEALQAGDLVAGVPAFLVLDSGADDFYLLNPQNTGFRSIPFNGKTGSYTLAIEDAGKFAFFNTTSLTITIPANASVAYQPGTVLTFAGGSAGTIAINTDTLTLAGTSSTGSRSLAANGLATALKTSSTGWLISGTGLS